MMEKRPYNQKKKLRHGYNIIRECLEATKENLPVWEFISFLLYGGVFALSAGVLGGDCALCRRVKCARLMNFKRAIFC